MPKISPERKAERRLQILNAAWRCFQRQGLHATTMDDIIGVSGLSAGAVYGYFRGKEEIIFAAVTTSLSGVRELITPVLHRVPPPAPEKLLTELCERISTFTQRDGFDLRRLALLGWSEAQRNHRLHATMRVFYVEFRQGLAQVATVWRKTGIINPKAQPEEVAKALLATLLGYIVQHALLGDISPAALGRGMASFSPRAAPRLL